MTDSLIPEADTRDDGPDSPGPGLRPLASAPAIRHRVYADVREAAAGLQPLSDDRHTLRLTKVHYADKGDFSKAQHKQAILTGETLGRRLKGTWELHDNATGKLLESREMVVARVPHMTDLGTFVNRGSDYVVRHQQRLRPGVYVRRKENGEIEAHANVLPGKGVSHHYLLDPATGVFKLRLGQSEMPVMPLLKAMGATDAELRSAWGRDARGGDIHAANSRVNDGMVLRKLKARLLRKADLTGDEQGETQSLAHAFEAMELDPWITARTLGRPHAAMTKDAILDTTRKLLAVHRGEAPTDNRDHLAYQSFLGPEDLMAERVAKDHGRVQRQAFRKVSTARSLSRMPSGLLTPQVEHAILHSGLGQPIEEINTAETLDKLSQITRLGEGGIPALEAVPSDARGVQSSHYGFVDPLRTPESSRIGVDLNMARGVAKGRDGQIYARFHDPRTGKVEWKSPRDLADSALAFPGWHESPARRVPVLAGDGFDYAARRDVDHALPHMEDAFSDLGNLVPLKSMSKGGRVAMAGRMLTQALPLVSPEAPLVRGAVPHTGGARSFEEEHAAHMGAVRAAKGGRVVSHRDGRLRLRHDDGTTSEVELYNHHPFNRKTPFHQEPVVREGQAFRPGDLLARSNFTDEHGVTALGLNARTAYIPWKGWNFEDANVISESMARRMSSVHMYQHGLEVGDRHRLGKKNYASFFPQRHSPEAMAKLDDKGVVRPGQVVNHGEPLVVALREKELAENKVHKRRQPGFADESITWDHHEPGVVTDVAWGKSGPTVIVRSVAPMQVGDKMSGRYGDKGVVSAIVPDHRMPRDADGNPFEVLLNPHGIVSRTNPSQMAELWLGKVARHTGRPINVEDFSGPGKADMLEWVHGELRKHGLSDTETLVDPETSRKIPGIPTGHRFFVKLHHMAASKAQGRGGGGYTLEGAPAKGGESGCFAGDTEVVLEDAVLAIRDVVEGRDPGAADSRDVAAAEDRMSPIVDWFARRVPPSALVEIELEGGAVVTATRNHGFYLGDGTEILAGALAPGDDLME